MKTLLAITFLVTNILFSQHWVHNFESVGGYTTSIPEFTDGAGDYFLRTNGSDISSSIEFSGIEGNYYFAAQDVIDGSSPAVFITFENIDISGQTGLEFGVLLAEDDASDGNEDWDNSDYLHILYSIDGSEWENLLWVENDGDGTNSSAFIDSDFDGVGDGTEITDTFSEFIIPIAGTGNNISIKVEFNFNSGDEDIAIDNLRIGTDLNPLPVELTTFSASIFSDGIKLDWETATEVNNYGFEVERQDSETQVWENIGFVNGHGNSNSKKVYSFLDKTLFKSGNYYYRLKQIDIDGKFEYSDKIEISFLSTLEFELSQNYPNPFNPSTTIKFLIPEDGFVRLTIHNVLGEEITKLLNENIHAGYHSIEFNAQDLNSGIYFYKLEVGDFIKTRKMMLLK